MKRKKQDQGITLIALVITIIVLLILAGVTVQTLTGDNGLFGKTSEAKFITEIEQYNEELKLAITEDYTNSMGNRQNKFNVRRISYNDENSFINAMKTKIPSFNSKYANKLEIKEDKLNYIGEDEQERAWLAQVISVAGMLKINYVYEDGTEAATPYQQVIPDGSYEVESPTISGYEPDHYIVCGEIEGDTNITVTYYGESQGLAYELLADGTYTVAGIGSFAGENLVIPEKYNDIAITQIKANAFFNNNIEKLIISSNINIVNSNAYSNCNNLKYLNLNARNIANYTVFDSCSNLESVEIGKDVETIGYWEFRSCSKLENLIVNTSIADITAEKFTGCSKLKEIKVNKNNTKYTTIDGVLYSKDEKKIYMYPIAKDGEIYEILSNIEEIGRYAFNGNQTLKEINIPDTVKVIEYGAFDTCSNLEKLRVDAQTIKAYYAFNNCKKLKEITIGKNVKSIGHWAFSNCNNIQKFSYEGIKAEWNTISKDSEWKNNSNIIQVICLDGKVDL